MSIEERVRKVVSEQLDVSGEIDNNASLMRHRVKESIIIRLFVHSHKRNRYETSF